MDSHTLVMASILGLAARSRRGHPSTLFDCGYRVPSIEATVRVGDRSATPDVVLLNEGAGHLLAIDGKSGANVDLDQDARYSQMALDDLAEAVCPPCAVGSHTVAYAINEENEERVRGHTSLALIVFGGGGVRAVGDLGHDSLAARLLEGVPLPPSALDLGIYPFSAHDGHGHIDAQVAPAVSACLAARPELVGAHLVNLDVAREVLAVAHPFHASFSASHRKEMARVVKQSLARLEAAGELARMLAALRGAGGR